MLIALQDPNRDLYQEKWREFFSRYHKAIVNYVLRKANWPPQYEYQAEDIASLVYEKGFRYSFANIPQGVRFRHVLMQLVKQCLSDYSLALKRQAVYCRLENLEVECEEDSLPERLLRQDIIIEISKRELERYEEFPRYVLQTIQDQGKLPSSADLANKLGIGYDAAQKKKQRNKEKWLKLWKEYREGVSRRISEIAYGDSAISREQQTLKAEGEK